MGDLLIMYDIFLKDIKKNDKPITQSIVNLPIYDSIPSIYNGLERWPISTNLRCWECSLQFDNRPCFIPTNPRRIGKTDTYDVYGNFCKWQCAIKYAKSNISPNNLWFTIKYIGLLCKSWYNINITDIPDATDKIELAEYCGPHGMDKDSFKKLFII